MKNKLIELLPEINEINDEELGEKTINVWLKAMELGNWDIDDLEQIPFTLLIPDNKINLITHTRAVTQIAMASGKTFTQFYDGTLDVNMDYLISGALLHDVGKLMEYEKDEDGNIIKGHFGHMLRHPFSGSSLAYKMELPDEVCHMIAVHAREGERNRFLPESIIVNHADFINFESLKLKLKE